MVQDHEGGLVRLSDVSRVEDGAEDAETSARRNGVPTVVLSIRKQSGENTIAVVDGIKERLDGLRSRLPAGYRIEIVRDNSLVIRTSVNAVKEHLVLGSIPGGARRAVLPGQRARHHHLRARHSHVHHRQPSASCGSRTSR